MIENSGRYICAVAILLLAFPVWARPESTRTDTVDWIVSQSTMVGKTEIKPGDYTLKAQESKNTMEVLRDGKVIAQVPVHWIELPKKANNTEVSTDSNQVVQVQFAGRMEAIHVQ